MSIESPFIGSGSQAEADLRVQALLDLGKARGYITYEELNERLPDEVVSPDKLDNLLMKIDEMGIRLIDETDIGEFITVKAPRAAAAVAEHAAVVAAPAKKTKAPAPTPAEIEPIVDENGEE